MYRRFDVKMSDQQTSLRAQLVSFAYGTEDCLGVEEFSLTEDQVDTLLGERAYSGGDVPESVIDEVDDNASRKEELITFFFKAAATGLGDFRLFLEEHSLDYSEQVLEEEDWDANWRQTYSPVKIDESLWIIPQWMKNEYPEKHCLYIYPGQGFGTGQHQTTSLCLKLFVTLPKEIGREHSCLDLGCGSGILGIAALKLRGMPTIFCDIDKAALDNTVQNIYYNFVDSDLSASTVCLRDKLDTSLSHQVVFANILLSALISEKKTIIDSVQAGGFLIASGLLTHQLVEFKDNFSELEFVKELTDGDWGAVLMRKKH